MRDLRPRLLIIALGLLGFVAAPAAGATAAGGGAAEPRAVSGTHQAGARGQGARPSGSQSRQRALPAVRAHGAIMAIIGAWQPAETHAPLPIAGPPPPGVEFLPASGPARRASPSLHEPARACGGPPRGRAPPSTVI